MSRENELNTETEENSSPYLLWFSIILSFLFVLGVLYLTYHHLNQDLSNRGTFGDMFGGANALFSGMAFAGIIITIILQMRELKYQRQELRETKMELRRAAAAQEKSEQALAEQVKNMELSSKISLMSAIFNSYQTMATMGGTVSGTDRSDFTKKAKAQIKILEGMLSDLESKTEL